MAYLCAQRRTDGNILQVWFRAGNTPRRRRHLVKGRVNLLICAADRLHESIDIGTLELCELPVFNDFFNNGMLVVQLFQHLDIRRVSCFCLFNGRQAQFFKENYSQIAW